jgi:hypothetical protein
LERAVDNIGGIYAVVIALAISQAFQTLIHAPGGSSNLSFAAMSGALPAFIAFLFTVVPFWHGMNRHLDRCYLQRRGTVVAGAILFDFGVFLVEAGLLFAAAWSLRSGLVSFYCIGSLLLTDTCWGFASHCIHFRGEKSHVRQWASINVAAGALAAAAVLCLLPAHAAGALAAIAVLRTVVDYWVCWQFYFPIGGESRHTVRAHRPATKEL